LFAPPGVLVNALALLLPVRPPVDSLRRLPPRPDLDQPFASPPAL